MKRLLLLVVAAAFALTACGMSDTPKPPTTPKPKMEA
jgi:hypothetical protein